MKPKCKTPESKGTTSKHKSRISPKKTSDLMFEELHFGDNGKVGKSQKIFGPQLGPMSFQRSGRFRPDPVNSPRPIKPVVSEINKRLKYSINFWHFIYLYDSVYVLAQKDRKLYIIKEEIEN